MKFFGVDAGIFIIAFVIAAIFGVVTARTASRKGYNYAAFCAVGFFLGIIGLVIALVIPSKAKQDSEVADGLLKYKQLLDEGVITQEEFDQKKAKLLEG